MKLFLRSLLVCATVTVAFPAQAQNTIWSNNGSTVFETPSNWNNGLPTAGLNAYVVPNGVGDPTGAFLVTQGGQSDVIINAAASHTSSGLFITNDIQDNLPVGTVTLTFATGTSYTISGNIGVRDAESLTFSGSTTVGGSVDIGTVGGGSFTLSTGSVLDNSAGNSIVVGGAGSAGGNFTQNGTSQVNAGNAVVIGAGGPGNYTMNGNSALSTNGNTLITVGGANGTGTLTVNGAAVVGVTNGSSMAVGTGSASNGTVFQTGSTTQVQFSGNGSLVIGATTASNGKYNLQDGALDIGLTGADTASVTIGAANGAIGILTQSGGTLTTMAASTFTVGLGTGTGTYTITAGTGTFGGGLALGANGTMNVNGGTVRVAEDALVGTGTINFGGGTLALTAGANTTLNYGFNGTLTAGTSNFDTSAAGNLTTVNFTNALQGNGLTTAGINFIGNGTTTFNLASATGGASSTYTGSTSITGGTLNATAADLAGTSAGSTLTIATGSTLNLYTGVAANPPTLSQAIAGGGTLNVNFGAGAQTLLLASTSGSSTVNIVLGANMGPAGHATATPGTLQLLGGSFGTVSEVGVGNNVTIGDNTTASAVTFITGATYTGLTTVTNNASLTSPNIAGNVNVFTGGTLTVANQIGTNGANTILNSGTLTAGNIVGVVTNFGTMSVTGAAGIAGNVANNTGTLTTSLVTGNLNNNTGGFFINSGPINSPTVTGNVTNDGTLSTLSPLVPVAIGATPNATFTIGGTLTQTANGVLNIRISGTTGDMFQINGAGNSAVAGALAFSGSTSTGTNQFIVINDQAGTIDSTLLTTASPTALFSATIDPVLTTAHQVVVDTTQTPVATYAKTPNENAVAQSLDGAGGNNIKTQFNSVSIGAAASYFPSALEKLTPEVLQYARNIAWETTTYHVMRMNGIDADLRNGINGLDTNAVSVTNPGMSSGLGRTMKGLFAANDPAFHSAAPNGVNYYPGESGRSSASPISESTESSAPPAFDSSSQVISDSPNPYLANVKPGSSESPRMSEFIGGDVVLADLNRDQSQANAPSSKASYTAGDATAGVSFRVTNHFAAGVLFDYNHTDADTDSSGSKTKVDTYSPGVFATYFDHGFYANGLASFGYNNYKNTRDTGFGTASSSPSGQQYVGDLDLGYDFHPDKNWIVGPTLGVTYTHLDIDSFTETGSQGANLAVQSQSADSFRSRFGGHVVYQTNTGDVLLQPNFTAMWQHEFLADSDGITSSFNDFTAAPFTIQTAAPSRDSALIGVGLTASLSTSLSLYLNYLADVGAQDAFSQSVIGGFKARF